MTSLYGGKRVLKSDSLVEAYGTVDELSSFMGLTVSKIRSTKDRSFLISIQKDLYLIMASLSGTNTDLTFLDPRIMEFERAIDQYDKKLPKLTKFIIPGGNEVSALFQVLRVLTRRAERKTVALDDGRYLLPIKYLNRLSDLFFTMARSYNRNREIVL